MQVMDPEKASLWLASHPFDKCFQSKYVKSNPSTGQVLTYRCKYVLSKYIL